jgi:trimethylamine--corrinoid protein Co-methyltransferase
MAHRGGIDVRVGVEGGQLKILSSEDIDCLYLAILNVLETHGVKIDHEGVLRLLKDIGATVDFKAGTACFPEYIVEESLRKAPKRIRLCGRDKRQDFLIEGKKAYFGSVGGATVLVDRDTGERRSSRTSDMAETARICDAMENIDYSMGLYTPLDAPHEVQGLYEQDAVMSNSVKHSIIFAYHGAGVTRKQIEIAQLIAGGEEELRKRPIVSMYDEPTSPLAFGEDYVEAMIEWVKEGLPLVFAPCPMSGATAPITLAGEIVSGMAESIAGNVIAQFTRPGTPFIFGFVPLTMDMRTTLCSYGAPENMMLGIAQAQLAHHLKIPMWGTGGCTDSKTLDAQTFVEASMNLSTAALSGQNLIHDIGLVEGAKSGSQELIVVCDEVIGMLRRIMGGVHVDDKTLAVEEIKEAKHGGSFLGLKHSLEHFESEHRISPLMDRTFSYDLWKKAGGKTLVENVRERIRKILKDHQVEPIPRDVRTQIEAIKKDGLSN